MPNRILYESICCSETLAALSAEEERLFYRFLVQCDDFGRMHWHASIIRSRCFQLGGVTDAQVEKWMAGLSRAGLVVPYIAENRTYAFVTTWDARQRKRADKSKYPDPPPDGVGGHPRAPADIGMHPRSTAPVFVFENENECGSEGGSSAPAPRRPPAQRLRRWPDDFTLTDERRQFALDGGIVDPALVWGAFKDHHLARGSTFVDWGRAWQTWCRKEVKWEHQRRRA